MSNGDPALTLSKLTVHIGGAQLTKAVQDAKLAVAHGETIAIVGRSGDGKSTLCYSIVGVNKTESPVTLRGQIEINGIKLLKGSGNGRRHDKDALSKVRGHIVFMALQDPLSALNPYVSLGKQIEETLRKFGASGVSPRRANMKKGVRHLWEQIKETVRDFALSGMSQPRTSMERRVRDLWEQIEGTLKEFGPSGMRQRRANLRKEVEDLWDELSLPDTAYSRGSSTLSGGQAVRAMLAILLAAKPHLVLLDEPTASLDPISEHYILREIQRKLGERTKVIVTHKIDPIAALGTAGMREFVMLNGHLAPLSRRRPAATASLMPAATGAAGWVPAYVKLSRARGAARTSPGRRGRLLLSVKNLCKMYDQATEALNGVDLELHEAEHLGIIGISGSGKTTLTRCITGEESTPLGNEVQWYLDSDAQPESPKELSRDPCLRNRLQMVTQHPERSLHPAQRIGDTIRSSMQLYHKLNRGRLVTLPAAGSAGDALHELLDLVGLSEDLANEFPRTLSGGQRRRAEIANVLAASGWERTCLAGKGRSQNGAAPPPRVLALDEFTEGLDLVTQEQIFELLEIVRSELNITFLVVSHDFRVIERLCSRCIVLYGGTVVEEFDVKANRPALPYTKMLTRQSPIPGSMRAGAWEPEKDVAWALCEEDVADWKLLCSTLAGPADREVAGLRDRVWERLQKSDRGVIQAIANNGAPDEATKSRIVTALNGVLRKRDLMERGGVWRLSLPRRIRERLPNSTRDLPDLRVWRLNRILLDATCPYIVRETPSPKCCPMIHICTHGGPPNPGNRCENATHTHMRGNPKDERHRARCLNPAF